MTLKPWMGYARDMASDAAVLVFARNHREARQEAYHVLSEGVYLEYIDTRARLLSDPKRFMKFCKRDKPHGFLDIPDELTCVNCHKWGFPIDGGHCCSECAEHRRMEERWKNEATA